MSGEVRQRKDKKRPTTPNPDTKSDHDSDVLNKAMKEAKGTVLSEWDYKLALAVITVLAFVTRFYGIGYPDQVVFDEVHFGKVSASFTCSCLSIKC